MEHTRFPLHHRDDHARRRREEEERYLLLEEFLPRGGREPVEGPVIQEEEDEGKGNHHLFGHEPQGKDANGCGVGRSRSFTGVSPVGDESQEEETGREDILPFRSPGDGFHMEGVEGEEGACDGGRDDHARKAREDEKEEEGV